MLRLVERSIADISGENLVSGLRNSCKSKQDRTIKHGAVLTVYSISHKQVRIFVRHVEVSELRVRRMVEKVSVRRVCHVVCFLRLFPVKKPSLVGHF